MYGLVNRAIEQLITSEHGVETWRCILAEAGIAEASFLAMRSYPDEVTYALVGAASRVLAVQPDVLLHAFGRYWMRYTAQEGYGELLDLTGASFAEFAEALDDMHARVSLTFPQLRPPSFRFLSAGPGLYELHYHSEREGLTPMVLGLLDGLAERFGTRVDVRQLQRRETHGHDVFSIRELAVTSVGA